MFAVVNLKTGRVITPEWFSEVVGVNLYADEFLPNTESDGWGSVIRVTVNYLSWLVLC